MATIKQRVHKYNGSGYDIVHYETEASLVLYTKNSQSNVEGALDTLFTDVAGKAASSHNHAASNITSGTLSVARGGTGGANATAAADSLQVVSLGNGTAIPNTDDLDTYTTIGNYHCALTSDAKKIKHVPGFSTDTLLNTSFGAFTMKVGYATGTGYPCQTIIRYDTGVRYYRVQSSDTWGAWKEFAQNTNTTYSNFKASGSSAAAGLVPSPGTTAGTTKYLREDATWAVPPDTNTVYTHPTTSGNKHIPSGGSSGQFLKWSADGTAVWAADNNTTYSNFVKSGSTAAAGLVPSPGTTAGTTKYLREDATWAVPPDTNTTYSDFTAATSSAAGTHGLVPAPASGKQDSFLRGNKTWANASDIINTLSTGDSNATAADYLVAQYAGGGTTTTTYHRRPVSKVVNATVVKAALGTGTGTTKYLREDGTWVVPPDTNTNTTYTFATGDANGQIKVTPSGGTASNISVKGLGSAAYTASTSYLAAFLGRYNSSTVATEYFIKTTLTAIDSADYVITGIMETSKGLGNVGIVRFGGYWSKTELKDIYYWDPLNIISSIRFLYDSDNVIYIGFKQTTRYTETRIAVHYNNQNGAVNVANSISTTAPTTITATVNGTRVYSVLADSGATAGSYGPSANASPTHGGTFSVPYVTIDAKGRVTAASTKTITLPADSNTDTKVTQTVKTDSVERPILTAPTAQTATTTTTAVFSTNIKANASTGTLSATKIISNGDLTVNSGYLMIKPYSSAYDSTGSHAGIKLYFNHDKSGVNADTLITASSLQAANFYGGGSGLTALNATQITSGTIPSADRLPTVTIAKGGTGKTTALDAITALGGWSHLSRGTAIGSTSSAPKDLNTYTTPGVYFSANSAESQTITNAPSTGAGFKLHVLQNYSSNYRFQLVISGTETLYYRGSTNTGSTWTAWKQLRPWTATTGSVGSASGWSAGTAASASIASGVLTITNGTKPALTVTSTTVVTGVS